MNIDRDSTKLLVALRDVIDEQRARLAKVAQDAGYAEQNLYASEQAWANQGPRLLLEHALGQADHSKEIAHMKANIEKARALAADAPLLIAAAEQADKKYEAQLDAVVQYATALDRWRGMKARVSRLRASDDWRDQVPAAKAEELANATEQSLVGRFLQLQALLDSYTPSKEEAA